MHKNKKKSAKLPKPIKVKKEKSDEERLPQPMSHYIDDRLELVKQVFGTLKPKTIINLAPDFLKSQGLDEIEEACLNELLCISTKRLKSIITATKCPTDTESSDDNDDDVRRKDEHVSLEEISSDSEIEKDGHSKKAKVKRSLKTSEKSKTEKSKTNDAAPKPEDGQISVLELLELQARARAIRSQLALEPVTKIEVDSDGEAATDKNKGGKDKSKKDKKLNKTSERPRTSSARVSQDSSKTITIATEKEPEKKTKKIKLKRNYRNASSSASQSKEGETSANAERTHEKENNPTDGSGSNKNQDQNRTSTTVKKERLSRSVSPDVVPIVAEPETLLINDSSDELELKDSHPNVEKDVPEKAGTNDAIQTKKINENDERNKTAELEEGELCTGKDDISNKSSKPNKELEEDLNSTTQNEASENKKQNDLQKPSLSEQPISTKTVTYPAADDAEEDEDHNDDIISLGEDLEDEMNEQLENEVNSSVFKADNREESSSEKSKTKSRKEKSEKTKCEDDQQEDNQSWHSRYMKSSKVSKVLAASRLGKRVRDKIKKSKDDSREIKKAEKKEPAFSSKHEDGSLDQYKELLELRNRKSK